MSRQAWQRMQRLRPLVWETMRRRLERLESTAPRRALRLPVLLWPAKPLALPGAALLWPAG